MNYLGKIIRIISLYDEPFENRYIGKTGRVLYQGKDPWGDEYLSGTWAGINLYLGKDQFEIVEEDEEV